MGLFEKEHRLRLSVNGVEFVGFGASEGDESWLGASRESRIRPAMIQLTRLLLEKL